MPEADFQTIVVQPSEIQKKMVASLSERAAKVHAGAVDASVDNMLCITSDGRKIGLDQRLMNPLLPDAPGSKLNACVNNVFQIWQDGVSDRTTQLLFCDMSTPKGDGSFNVYAEYRAALSEMQEYQKARHNVEAFFEMQQKEEEQECLEQRAQNR